MDDQILGISNSVQWIGVLDRDIKTFDIIMTTEYGTTYNAYFINAQKKAIVDTAKETFFDTYLAKLKSVTKLDEIEYIIVSHTEPDHSGSLRRILELAPNATVVASAPALKYLRDQIGHDFPQQVAKDGDIIDLGDQHLRIISAPSLHWPDTIYSYLEEEEILFTCDSFGAHFCHEAMYDDLVGNYDEAYQYYFDVILKPFSKFYLKAIDKIKNLDIKAICPGHGPILRKTWKEVIAKTAKMCQEYIDHNPEKNRILLAFVSAYGYTKTIAEKIAEGLKEVDGLHVDFCDIEKMSREELEDKISRAAAFLIGSPTINQNMLPQIYAMFSIMTPLRDRGKLAGCFGAYGWSGEAERDIITNIENLKLNYFGESIFLRFRPQEYDFDKIKDYGKRFGQQLVNSNTE
ncbi:FprA family A-type flavoprotein [Bacteroidales bacterium OttesenSCG-928-C03]|nr:FprA family A-type flavoprotein [Bacteroidales bacterium OttesenSCG-928-C03]